MDSLIKKYNLLLKYVSLSNVRSIYNNIEWNSRLIGIKGARGVGKTTLLLQRILLAFPDTSKALYASLDDIWFSTKNIIDLAELATERDITHLFLDEIHRMPGWERQIKNIYDFFPNLSIAFTGSSLLVIDQSIADLSRRCLMYSMPGLSFREFLIFEGIERQAVTLDEILYRHTEIAPALADSLDMLSMFSKYLKHGYYPFYKTEGEKSYWMRVANVVTSVIDYDIPSVENVEYATLLKTKQLLSIMAAQTPSPLNATALTRDMGISKNHVIKLLSLLDRAQILRLLYYKNDRSPKSLSKPQKVLIDNPSIAYALGQPDKGKIRESFLASMCAQSNVVSYPKVGDLQVNNRYILEVGGQDKGFTQIKDMPDTYVAADGILYGLGNKLPLWLFGFLY